jgi:hypothetical protein
MILSALGAVSEFGVMVAAASFLVSEAFTIEGTDAAVALRDIVIKSRF